MFTEIESLINEMIENVGKIRRNRENNSFAVTEQKQIIESEIRELRTKVNNHLDKLQEFFLKELTEAETTITEKTCELMASLDEREKEITEYQTNIVNIKQYASDLQTFLAMKQIENDVETHDTSLHALFSSDSLNQTKLSCKIDTSLKNIATSIDRFGEVIVESKPSELSLVRKKDKQAQMMVADPPHMSVDNIQLNLKQTINTKGVSMRGCSLLTDGRMVLSCYNDDIVRFINEDGVELFQIGKDKTRSCIYDTVYIKDNNSVAVSSGGGVKRCITIIDIEKKEIMTTISMDTYIYSMAVRGRTIYYCAGDKGLKMINLSDKSVSDIINSNMSDFDCVATSRDKLYYTTFNTHTVTCCDLHGTTQWEFNDQRVLKCPCGISVDNEGNVYVVGNGSNNVVVISSDGQRHRQLLSKRNGLARPAVLDYDRSTNNVLVVNDRDTAFLFGVTRLQ
jgi:DNA-binding beta-propeller fold protein YncE